MECGSKFEVMDVMSGNKYNRDIRDVVILIEEGLNTIPMNKCVFDAEEDGMDTRLATLPVD